MVDERSREDPAPEIASMLELGTPASLPYQLSRRSLGVVAKERTRLQEQNVLLTPTVGKCAGPCHYCIFVVNASQTPRPH
jgi:hypothetical protein